MDQATQLRNLIKSEQETKVTKRPLSRVITVTSGKGGVGKSNTAINLALQFKKLGKRVIILDADFGLANIEIMFGTVPKHNFCDLIYQGKEITDIITWGPGDVGFISGGSGIAGLSNLDRKYLEYIIQNLAKLDAIADVIIIDTAGRLHINEELMQELQSIKSEVKPHEILLVVDAMTGQDAVNVAESFNSSLGLDGIVMTKMDGDARGGAALSVKAVTGCPIKFVGMGEKLEALEPFYPDRMASRILGMGDVLSLIEKAQDVYDMETAQKMEKKFRKDEFTLDDFLDQLQQVRKMGSFEQILGMLPGMGNIKKQLEGVDVDFNGKEIKHVEAIIRAMTPQERADISVINGSRRKRIALGSGTRVQDVNKVIKQFAEMKKMMKKMKKMQKSPMGLGRFKLPFMH